MRDVIIVSLLTLLTTLQQISKVTAVSLEVCLKVLKEPMKEYFVCS